MHIERLERMRDLLRRDAANPTGVKFDLSTWAEPAVSDENGMRYYPLPKDVQRNADDRYYTALEAVKVPVSCDTMACAFGLAAISGEFAAEGLSYSFMTGDGSIGTLMPTLGRHHGMTAAAHLFGIETTDAQYFFDPECYEDTPREAEGELLVAQRIEDFINGIIDENYHPDYRDNGEGEYDEA